MHWFHKFILLWNYVFQAARLSITRSLFTVHSVMVHVIQVCIQLWAGPGWNSVPSWSCLKVVYKPVWQIPLLSVQWINSWWRTDKLSETSRVSWQNKFVKSVHLVCFIIKKSYSCVTSNHTAVLPHIIQLCYLKSVHFTLQELGKWK